MARIRELRAENAPRIGSAASTSLSGYDIAAWADRGYQVVLELLEGPGAAGDDAPLAQWLPAFRTLLKSVKDVLAKDPADEDGGRAGAISDALMAIDEVEREAPAAWGSR